MARMEEKAMDQAPIWDDLESFDGKKWSKKVDIVTAGFPCQPFSVCGNKKGLSDKRWIWPSIARILKEVLPKTVFLENVSGFVSMGLESVLSDLATLGYDAKWCCIPASAVGAPHERERFFMLAYTAGPRLPWKERPSKFESRFTRCNKWEPEPSVCRVDDGTPDRVDRLHCLGNAVIPAQAELAWRILSQ
jgi:DNA (cytosine-5)-methyltransferase 1